jgi:hypothetical protein
VNQRPNAQDLTALLDVLERVKSHLAEGVGRTPAPEELATSLGRVADDLDASIYKLRDIISPAQG